MKILKVSTAIAASVLSTTTSFAHVGDHAMAGATHVLVEHGVLIALAAMAIAALCWIKFYNRPDKT